MTDREQPDTELDIQFKTDPSEETPAEGIRLEDTHSVRIVMSHDVSEKIDHFAATDTTREVGGILLGRIVEDSSERTVLVQAHVEARFTEARQGSVTFTHQSWDYMHNERERKYPKLGIVGWFHTHPGFGIFLSPQDLFIHRNFFDAEWQLAYVVDPKSHTKGFFRRDGDEIVKCKFHIGGEKMISDFADLRREHAKCHRKYLRACSIIKWLLGAIIVMLISLGLSLYIMNNMKINDVNSEKVKYEKIILDKDKQIELLRSISQKISEVATTPNESSKPSTSQSTPQSPVVAPAQTKTTNKPR